MTLLDTPPSAPRRPSTAGLRWLDPAGPGSFRAAELGEAVPDPPPAGLARYLPLLGRLGASSPLSVTSSALVEEALDLWARPGFETLASLPRLRFEPFPYQVQAAQRVLRHMGGRAILADEVGLAPRPGSCGRCAPGTSCC